MKGVEEKLQSRQPLLTVDDGPLLHRAHRILYLLQNDRSKKVRIVLPMWMVKESFRDTNDVIPKRFPLVFFVPDVWALEQWHDKPLWMHEHGLGSSDLRFQEECPFLLESPN